MLERCFYLRLSDLCALKRELGAALSFRPALAVAALNAPAAATRGTEIFPTLPLKAAVLFSRLARMDVFIGAGGSVDGARACMSLFLARNGLLLPDDADARGLSLLLRKVAEAEAVEEALAFWLRDNLVAGVSSKT